MRQQRQKKQSRCHESEERHLPEWRKVFSQLNKEAKELHPDGRLEFLIPDEELSREELLQKEDPPKPDADKDEEDDE